jgi:hypothetical protein
VPNLNEPNSIPKRWYRPEKRLCPACNSFLKRHHILWHKELTFLSGPEHVVSWAYRCPNFSCAGPTEDHFSLEAESLHLKYRRYSREVVIHAGYRRFWLHQTTYEVHDWLTQDLKLAISERQVLNLVADFLALLRAAQPAKVCQKLQGLSRLVIGVDGMQPEKGNTSLYIVRELQSELTLLAENLEESSTPALRKRLFEPLKTLAQELGLTWHGVVSDAQRSIRIAVAQSFPGVPHQVCQFHCLRDAGTPTFEADRSMKKSLKVALRQKLAGLEKRIERLQPEDLFRAVLADYADAIQSALLEGGVAPFELGGLRLYAALEDLAASLTRCQKRGIICYYKD